MIVTSVNGYWQQFIEWSKLVRERDGYKCQCCGNLNNSPLKLHAHHFIPWHWVKELRVETDIGITLCTKCHANAHKKIRIESDNNDNWVDYAINIFMHGRNSMQKWFDDNSKQGGVK